MRVGFVAKRRIEVPDDVTARRRTLLKSTKELASMGNQFPTGPMLVNISTRNSLIANQMQVLSRKQSIH